MRVADRVIQYTTPFKRAATDIAQKVHYTGNNLKAMHISVEASLKKLRTDYIDILYVHWVGAVPLEHNFPTDRVAVGLGH